MKFVQIILYLIALGLIGLVMALLGDSSQLMPSLQILGIAAIGIIIIVFIIKLILKIFR